MGAHKQATLTPGAECSQWTKAFGWLRGHEKTLVQQVGWIDSGGVLGFHSPEHAGMWGGGGACIPQG